MEIILKKLLFIIKANLSKYIIAGAGILCAGAVTTSVIFLSKNTQNGILAEPSGSSYNYGNTSSYEDDTYSSSDTETDTETVSATESTTIEDTTSETTTVKKTTRIEYTTIPLEEISTTNDIANRDEVMGGDNEDDDVPTPVTTKPVTTVAPTTSQTETSTTVAPTTTTSKPTTSDSATNDSATNDSTTNDSATSSTEPVTSEATTEKVTTEEPTTEYKKPSQSVIKRPDDYVLEVSYGVDVSKYQGKIDWKKAKAAGVDFAMIKLGGRGYGTGIIYEDEYFKANIEGAIANGIKVGVYFFSQAITIEEAIEEASFCIALLKNYNIDYPVCFDFEQGTDHPENPSLIRRTYAAMKAGTLTKELLTEITCAFCNTLENSGYDSMIYASRNSWKGARWDGKFLNENYRTWLAVWYKNGSSSMLPTFGTGNTNLGNTFKSKSYEYWPTFQIDGKTDSQFLMWQYSEKGSIDGINASVDLDMCMYISKEYNGYESPMKVNVKNAVINTTLNKSVNVLTGVTATNTLLSNVTSSVKYTITNQLGATVSLSDAIKNTGSYKITYVITDFTWCKRYNYATLNVYKNNTEMSAALSTTAATTTSVKSTTS